MAVDLAAIRRRVQELSGARRNSNIQLWKPEIGEHKVRGLPWKNTTNDLPFMERWFYYLGDGPGIVTPHQFGKPDPINDLIRKLYNSGTPEDRNLAKQLQPRMRAYVPIIVRGEEDKGVQVWAFGKPIYQRLLSFYYEEDVGDILDPSSGFDLKVMVSHVPGKMFKGKPSFDTTVDAARKPSKLHEDGAKAKEWMDAVPNLDDMYKLKSVEEIEVALHNWLNGGDTTASGDTSDGTAKGAPVNDELANLVAEVRGDAEEAPKAEKKPAKAAKAATKAKDVFDEDDDAPPPKVTKDLDAAFETLMNE